MVALRLDYHGKVFLLVIARNSAFTYKGRAVYVRTVGRELGVRYVLEGSVRKVGGRGRITGQLIDAMTRAGASTARRGAAWPAGPGYTVEGSRGTYAGVSPNPATSTQCKLNIAEIGNELAKSSALAANTVRL